MIDPKPRTKVNSINTSMGGNTHVVNTDRNTPTILGQQENPNKSELIVADDGTTTVGNYKLGKFLRKLSQMSNRHL